MSDQSTLLTRIGKFFGFGSRPNGDLPVVHSDVANEHTPPARSTFLRPWARRDAAIAGMQDSLRSFADLMNSIRTSLEQQGRRQEELLGYLSNLPALIESLPESAKAQAETLRTVCRQLEQQTIQQDKLNDILEKISVTTEDQKSVLENLGDRVQTLGAHDQAISDNLRSVGAAMQTVSRVSESSAQVLSQLREDQSQRDANLEQVLHRQNVRFTTMLSVAIFMSVAALVTVSVIGFLLLRR